MTMMATQLCNIKVQPFDGDIKNWNMYSQSFKTLVDKVLPNNALKLAALRESLAPDVRARIADSLVDPPRSGSDETS